MYWYVILYFAAGLQSKLSQLLLMQHVIFLATEDAGDTEKSKKGKRNDEKERQGVET
jgi:hypothetical protein